MKSFDKNETGELIAAIHSLSKDKVRELALLMWQHIHAMDAANSPEIPDGWVSCDERMPPVNDVAITANSDSVSVCLSEASAKYRYFTSIVSGREVDVTHWMPLPAPPKQEK